MPKMIEIWIFANKEILIFITIVSNASENCNILLVKSIKCPFLKVNCYSVKQRARIVEPYFCDNCFVIAVQGQYRNIAGIGSST